MKTFNEIFEELARHNDRSIIWNNWLDYTIDVNLLTLAKNKHNTNNYHGNEEAYWDMIIAWMTELSQKLEKYPYYDILGQFYEELVQSQAKASNLGQFYTPSTVTELLSTITIDSQPATSLDGRVANDPTCGSARMLLSAHVHSHGRLFLYGQELDETSAKMAALNFWSHGCRGSILHMDTLTGNIFKGWRVNRYLHHGVPVPHIELISSEAEALDFIELNHLFSNGNVDYGGVIGEYDDTNDDDGDDVVVEKVTSEYKPSGTGQTTLF